MNQKQNILVVLRLVMSFIFLWAFASKPPSWINGVSPTFGFLAHAVEGPFAGFFGSLAGVTIIDWLFMLGLLFVGITLLINRYIKWGALAGIVMMFLIWLSIFPPENNPLVDEHIVYILVLALFATSKDKVQD